MSICRCRLRVIDAYGTHAKYNDKHYASAHNLTRYYGGLGLNLKQFQTFYRKCKQIRAYISMTMVLLIVMMLMICNVLPAFQHKI